MKMPFVRPILACVLGAASLAVWAGDPEESAPPAQRVDQTLNRYRFLDLSEAQAERLRAILAESLQQQDKSRRETDSRIREVLDDNQKKKFEEMSKHPFGRGFGRGEGRPGGPPFHAGGAPPIGGRGRPHDEGLGRSGWLTGPLTDELRRELGLTPEKREQIEALFQKSSEAIRARIEEIRAKASKAEDWMRVRAEIEKIVRETTEKVKECLDPDQRAKYEKLLEARRPPFGAASRREASPEERAARAIDALRLPESDQAAAKALLLRVAKLQADLAKADRAVRDGVRDLLKTEGTTDEALAGRLADIRRARRDLDEQLRGAQDELRQGRTPRQEAELLLQGFVP